MPTLVIEQTQILFFGNKNCSFGAWSSVEIDVRTAIKAFTYWNIFIDFLRISLVFSRASPAFRPRPFRLDFFSARQSRRTREIHTGAREKPSDPSFPAIPCAAGGFRDRFERCSPACAQLRRARRRRLFAVYCPRIPNYASLVPCTGASYQLRNYYNYRYCYCACVWSPLFGVQRTVEKKESCPNKPAVGTRVRFVTRRADYTRHVNTVSSRTTAPCTPDTRLQWRFPGRVRTCTMPKTVTAGPPLHRNGPSEPRHRDFASRFLTNALYFIRHERRRWSPRGEIDERRPGSYRIRDADARRRIPSKKYHEIRPCNRRDICRNGRRLNWPDCKMPESPKIGPWGRNVGGLKVLDRSTGSV